MSAAELHAVDYAMSPAGILHLIGRHPSEGSTLCGVNARAKTLAKGVWTVRGSGENAEAVCLPCRIALRQSNQAGDRLGNTMALEGVDRCACGCKYWENDRCCDCDEPWSPEARGEDV